MTGTRKNLEKLVDIVKAIEELGCTVTGFSDVARDGDNLRTNVELSAPVDSDIFATEEDDSSEAEEEEQESEEQETEDDGGYWCGRCGDGPMKKHGVKIHHSRMSTHSGVYVILDHEPEESNLEPLSPESDEEEEVEDEEEEDEVEEEEESETAEQDNIKDTDREKEIEKKRKRFKKKNLPVHMPAELEPPRGMDKSDVVQILKEASGVEEVSNELAWEVEKTERLLDNLGLAHGLVDDDGGEEEKKSEDGDPNWTPDDNSRSRSGPDWTDVSG